jgi:hypothetical protein
MTQALYAHMNNKTIKKILKKERDNKFWQGYDEIDTNTLLM